jgi:hypothetical protein
MGFGNSDDQKKSNELLSNNANTATSLLGNSQSQGNSALSTGMNYLHQFSNTLQAPTNYFQSLLSGNKAQTTAALSPDLQRINDSVQSALQGTNTLNARGGGRSSTLFNLPFASQAQGSGLFNQARAGAAAALPQIASQQAQVGLGQENLGGNLLNTGVSALNSGTGAASAYSQAAAQQQQQHAAAWNALGGGIFNLATGGLGDLWKGISSAGGIIKN